jgi:hypothetical protein
MEDAITLGHVNSSANVLEDTSQTKLESSGPLSTMLADLKKRTHEKSF